MAETICIYFEAGAGFCVRKSGWLVSYLREPLGICVYEWCTMRFARI